MVKVSKKRAKTEYSVVHQVLYTSGVIVFKLCVEPKDNWPQQ